MILFNGIKLDFTTFPNRETRVNGKQIAEAEAGSTGWQTLVLKYEDDSDLIKLMFAKRFLDDYFVGGAVKLELVITYMPYSRMDRVEGQSVFTLKYISAFINNLNFDRVRIVEPHSDVTMALVNRSVTYYPTVDLLNDVLNQIGFDKEVDYLFFPDAGAAKRYSKLTGLKTAVGHKQRDFATGKITDFQVVGVKDLSESKVLIIDDLCSYGGTFLKVENGKRIGAAAELKKLGAQEVYLFVAHAEVSIFHGDIFLDGTIDKVFTTDSILDLKSLDARAQIEMGNLLVFSII